MDTVENKTQSPFHNLVVEGGGAKNIACLGALKYLESKHYLDSVIRYAGSSAGSLICLFLVIGYTIDEIYDLLTKHNLNKIMKSHWFTIPFNLISQYGLNRFSKFKKFLIQILKTKGFHPNVTFGELYEKTEKVLVITGTNITQRKTVYFSYVHWKDLPVLDAIQASVNIPFFFTQHKINKEHYIDGGALMNFPLYYFDKYDETHELCCDSDELCHEFPDPVLSDKNDTIGVLTLDASDRPSHPEFYGNQSINNIYEYISSNVHTLLHNIEKSNVKSNFWNRSIAIQLPYEIELTNFNPPNDIQANLWNTGYQTARDYFTI